MACTTESITLRIARERPARRTLVSVLSRIVSLLERWGERGRQRRALLALDDRLLSDIGLSRADAEREGRKPFWAE